MKRRSFFKRGLLATLGTTLVPSISSIGHPRGLRDAAKNVIFLVSDGMSPGTLNMADILNRRKNGKPSVWVDLYTKNKVTRALMDTASANSMVTDSAAAGSAWGGGMRVNNGALNIGPNGERPTPILQKFQKAGKSVGCVTTVPVTHATPASFCVNNNDRNDQEGIAQDYLNLKFDLWFGGGDRYFNPGKRKDRTDLYHSFKESGYKIVKSTKELSELKTGPALGIFADDALPYSVDRENQTELKSQTPSLTEMTKKAIQILSKNSDGFMLQVEGGKVDWAAHGNDTPALVYDQLEFDNAVNAAIEFAEKDGQTLVVITTDHGNGEPGVFYGNKADSNFDRLQNILCSNEWVLNQIDKSFTPGQVIDLIENSQKVILNVSEAKRVLASYENIEKSGLYNPRQLPFKSLADFQEKHFSVHWANNEHSGVFVELAMFGPGAEKLPAMIENYKLHDFILKTTQL
ncbi:alkaline phosphatase [Arthrospiribacter ruber]|uniref:Alkaline phosphatase n=1 Tax=Arthrospiribacter ruber TaxID=2487934 RepID=A0A951J2S5_9BACT|nr:alkaline phosphatase [Arthrospiribacter ruber]MBW3469518.1 alkaline phosphatase [Arthrospiribacter ruber]